MDAVKCAGCRNTAPLHLLHDVSVVVNGATLGRLRLCADCADRVLSAVSSGAMLPEPVEPAPNPAEPLVYTPPGQARRL